MIHSPNLSHTTARPGFLSTGLPGPALLLGAVLSFPLEAPPEGALTVTPCGHLLAALVMLIFLCAVHPFF